MAKQLDLYKIEGTLGDLTFYKSKDGYMIRQKGGVNGDRIANDPSYQRTRENMSEFGRAGKAIKVLRLALRTLMLNVKDRSSTSRLVQRMMAVIHADAVSDRGLRNVIDGEAELLAGFEFNSNGELGKNLFAGYTAAIDRVTGLLTVDVDSFVPETMVVAPQGTTHFKIVSGGSEVDFEAETFVTSTSESDILAWNAVATPVISLSNPVTAASTKPLFLLVGIQYFQEVNGKMYPLRNGAFNPLSIVKVDGGV